MGAPSRATAEAPAPGRRGGSRFLVIGVAVLILVLAGGWYLFSNRSTFFPNAGSESGPGARQTAQATPIERAEKLHAEGKTKLAIAQLKRLPANDPDHEEAQRLIAEWSQPQEPEEPQVAPEASARRSRLAALAGAAAEEGEFLRVREALRAAAKISPLGPEEEALLQAADEALAPLSEIVTLMEDRDWDYALKLLWRERSGNPQNPDIQRMIVDCYYNLGVRDLQRRDQEEAIRNFSEGLALDPGDEDLSRHKLFAETYTLRQEDLLYRIYVKYLPFRTL